MPEAAGGRGQAYVKRLQGIIAIGSQPLYPRPADAQRPWGFRGGMMEASDGAGERSDRQTYKRFPVVTRAAVTLWMKTEGLYGFRGRDRRLQSRPCGIQTVQALANSRTLCSLNPVLHRAQKDLGAGSRPQLRRRVFFQQRSRSDEAAINSPVTIQEAGRHRFRITAWSSSSTGHMATLSATPREQATLRSAGRCLTVPSRVGPFARNGQRPAPCAEPYRRGGALPGPEFLKQVRTLCDEAGLLRFSTRSKTG